ncbi:hypothetical protein ANN_04364 [Periplaneta americana]|uniref:Uncharacterized protein n=1 Tax=Periplaneta americana TaxID=6978 RepID=A0ABQ8TAD8_PERAM|nr:hypothetical protein ANN_04364 [Periplaneta americana]
MSPYWSKNLNQVTCPDRDSNLGHLVSRPDALTVTPQEIRHRITAAVALINRVMLKRVSYGARLITAWMYVVLVKVDTLSIYETVLDDCEKDGTYTRYTLE